MTDPYRTPVPPEPDPKPPWFVKGPITRSILDGYAFLGTVLGCLGVITALIWTGMNHPIALIPIIVIVLVAIPLVAARRDAMSSVKAQEASQESNRHAPKDVDQCVECGDPAEEECKGCSRPMCEDCAPTCEDCEDY